MNTGANGGEASGSTSPPAPLRVVAIAGSLRRASYNRALLRACRELSPPELAIEESEIGEIPLYDADLDKDETRPLPVQRLKEAIAAADGVLLVTPEYNHSVPGVLQNALDWASRPGLRSPFRGKPVGLMGASGGLIGTARAQQQLKLVMMSMLAVVMPHAGVVVGRAATKFDESGALVDEATREFVAAYLREFAGWIRRVGAPVEATE